MLSRPIKGKGCHRVGATEWGAGKGCHRVADKRGGAATEWGAGKAATEWQWGVAVRMFAVPYIVKY